MTASLLKMFVISYARNQLPANNKVPNITVHTYSCKISLSYITSLKTLVVITSSNTNSNLPKTISTRIMRDNSHTLRHNALGTSRTT